MELTVSPVAKIMIRIFQTGTNKLIIVNRQLSIVNCHRGFTLIELIIVLFIISLSTAIIMPSFWATEESIIKSEARHISSTLRYIYDEAVWKKRSHLLNFNFDNKSWGFKSSKESRNFQIKNDVQLKDVIVPSNGETSRGELFIEFGPMGPEEPIILHLKKGDYEYTIIFNHLNGRTKILEGYKL